jgi:hypothetical protein
MSKTALVSLGGMAAILAAILRAIAAFMPQTTAEAILQPLYFFTDAFILLGVIALYGWRHDRIGKLGFGGFLLAIVGVLIIRSSKALTGVDLYPAGALAFAVGLNILGISIWRAGALPAWIVLLWVLSVLAGIAASLAPALGLLFAVAGLTFAAGFYGAGYTLRSAAKVAGAS